MILINKYIVWILRIPLAITFLVHGYPKILDCSGLISMGMPSFLAYLIGPFEFIGALFIILGPLYKDAISRLGSLMIAITLLFECKSIPPYSFILSSSDSVYVLVNTTVSKYSRSFLYDYQILTSDIKGLDL